MASLHTDALSTIIEAAVDGHDGHRQHAEPYSLRRALTRHVHARRVLTRLRLVTRVLDLHVLARGTPGLSGADLANLVNEAALYAVRAGKQSIEMAHFDEAREIESGSLETHIDRAVPFSMWVVRGFMGY